LVLRNNSISSWSEEGIKEWDKALKRSSPPLKILEVPKGFCILFKEGQIDLFSNTDDSKKSFTLGSPILDVLSVTKDSIDILFENGQISSFALRGGKYKVG